MKRGIIAVAMLSALYGAPAAADYLFIKIDLAKVTFGGGGGANQQAPGQPPPAGDPMAGGFGDPMGGFAQPIPKKNANPAFPNNPEAFKQGGGGAQGNRTNPAGMMGGAGMMGSTSPPVFGVGMMGGVPMGPMGYGDPGTTTGFELAKQEITVVLELKSVMKQVNPEPYQVWEADHKLGRRGRFPIVPVVQYLRVQRESPAREFARKFTKDLQDGKDARQLAYAASWALTQGLKTDFHKTMAALVKADPKHPVGIAYRRVQEELKKPLSEDDPLTQTLLAELRAEGYRMLTSDHYGMLTKLPPSTQTDSQMKRRLARFEETFENFFYWFALQEGTMPPMPNKRLLVLLAHDATDFYSKQAWWGHELHVADGFTPRRDNLIILSARRLDEDYAALEKNTQQLWAMARRHRDDLVAGMFWDDRDAKQNVFGLAAVQTLAIVQKAMEEESERAAITHEGTKQLVYATGILPRFVNVPDWAQFGLASFFDTPQGSLYGGVGLPSWSQLVAFKHYRKYNKLGGSSQATLMSTITDGFFRSAREAEDPAKEKTEKPSEQLEIARATSWALVYYLAQNRRMGNLIRFGQELSQLPRDLDLDDRTLEACFARAFDMADAKDPRRLDPLKLRQLADAWFAEMQTVNLEVPDAEDIYLGARAAAETARPAQRRGPGGPAPGTLPPGAKVQVPMN
jgi:hypothetical protein